MGRAAVILCFLVTGCGGGDAPPPELTAGGLVITTDPLSLDLDTPEGEFRVDDFVEVGVIDGGDPLDYVDPRDLPEDGVEWRVATRATGWDADSSTLTLDNGVRLIVGQGVGTTATASLVLDASEVDGAVLVRLVLPGSQAEPIYGFGQNHRSADAVGTVREMQFRLDTESESSLNEVHVPVPVALWPARGAGVYVQDERPGAFDVAAARADRVLATYALASPGPVVALLFTAAEPLGLVRAYAAMSALPALPPMWAFAPQQWRNVHQSSDEVRGDAQAMRDLDVPGSTIWIDNPWQTAYNDFTFDETRFAGAAQLIADLTDMGYRVLVWSTPYVNRTGPTEDDYAEAVAAGYLVEDEVGNPFVFPWQDGPGALVDFTADGATAWWQERIARAVDIGIDGFKLDFGEDVVPEFGGRLAPFRLAGGDAQVMHNRYAEHYHRAYLDALPEGDGFLITRAGFHGEQRVNTCIWPGDLDNDFSLHGVDNGEGAINVGGLPAAVADMLSLSVSGYPFFGSDIGGFRGGVPETESLLRWAEYAALGTIMQLGGGGGGGQSHNPWDAATFGDEALGIYRTYARLHMDLVPFIYTLAVRAAADGTPVTIPTRLVYPDAASDDATFLVGDALFVAPVIEAGATTREVVLPPGRWVDWWTGEIHDADGQTAITADAPLGTLPLWRREDALVPMFALAADTLEPAGAAGVTSYADPAYGRELRLLGNDAGGAVALWDGTTYDAGTVHAGTGFDIVTLELRASSAAGAEFDGSALTEVADENALMQCGAPGCWYPDTGATRVLVRVHLPDDSDHTIELL